jgi:hypothetical protein
MEKICDRHFQNQYKCFQPCVRKYINDYFFALYSQRDLPISDAGRAAMFIFCPTIQNLSTSVHFAIKRNESERFDERSSLTHELNFSILPYLKSDFLPPHLAYFFPGLLTCKRV